MPKRPQFKDRLARGQIKVFREYAHQHKRTTGDLPTYKESAIWILEKYHLEVKQYKISRYLGNKYLELDNTAVGDPKLNFSRASEAEWPLLEDVLYIFLNERDSRRFPTSREVLQLEARRLWETEPALRKFEDISNHTKPPTFGPKWCSLFQARWGLADHYFHGEAGSAEIVSAEVSIQELVDIRASAATCHSEDVYSFDHTTLYWRRLASSGLSAAPRQGVNLSRSRISLGLCTNATGTDRLPIWYVGEYETPHALRGFQWEQHRSVWRHNRTSCFTSNIMVEWFTAFYQHILRTKPNRPIFLVMDGSGPHKME